MKKFAQYLKEGGNVKIGAFSANPISITHRNRSSAAQDIHDGLHELHKSFHAETGNHLFGKNASALHSGAAYSGSTAHLMSSSIPDREFAKHKPSVGDIDVKVPREHMEKLADHLSPGRRFGKYTVQGIKKSRGEHHVLAKHDNGSTHQIDFEATKYDSKGPSALDNLSHGSSWEDTKHGIKGVHHKVLLANLSRDAGHKFSNLYGLGKREGDPKWDSNVKSISRKVLGPKADESHLHSFVGLTAHIKKNVPKERHQEVYDNFKHATTNIKNVDHTGALKHLKTELNARD